LEKEYFVDGGGEMIGAILTAHGSAWKNFWIFDRPVAVRVRSDDDDFGGVV